MSAPHRPEEARAILFQVWAWLMLAVSLYLLALGAFELGDEHDAGGVELVIAGGLLVAAAVMCFRVSVAVIRGERYGTPHN
ncbi:hypothetical protein [Glaciihabitans sp. dw_435]|uniref:hypothetical protein n=1 Tax=Glaciihabitans sp. dw_435 TaxID=2720081 RepID=UPI001BD4DFC8|nr:hypothetical protein [Glaciihabitans sp. dw_435]